MDRTSSPTPSPTDMGSFYGDTPAPFDMFPETPAPVTPAPVTPAPVTPAPVTPAPVTPAPVTPAPVTPAPVTPEPTAATPVGIVPAPTEAPVSDCVCVNTMSAEEAAVLERRNKKMVCDPTCSDDTDATWGERVSFAAA